MNRSIIVLILLLSLTGCAFPSANTPTVAPTVEPSATSTPTATDTPTPPPPTATLRPSATPSATVAVSPTPNYPPAGYGPTNFPVNVDPLTGLEVKDPSLLNRRPVTVKVENLPRDDRPQWGISSSDIVYEYYTEQGGVRFAVTYYGNDTPTVGPIRSARFFDFNVVRMYKSSFVFGYAYAELYSALASSEFSDRLIVEGVRWKDVFNRFDPNGKNILQANTASIAPMLKKYNVDNSRQNLDGMLFKKQVSAGGKDGKQLFVRFSGGIYNRWDYDPQSGKYLRFSDAADDVNRTNEQYTQLVDRLTNAPIAFDNVVVVQVTHRWIQRPPAEVVDMTLVGEGKAWIARDGQVYQLKWKRSRPNDVLSLVNPDGTPFAFKPGQTWFEVQGVSSTVSEKDGAWHFVHNMP